MLTSGTVTTGKNKLLVFASLVLACMLYMATNGYAQTAKGESGTIVPFGIKETGRDIQTTYDQILANPKLVCTEADCEVTGFEFSYVDASAKDPYMGPFAIAGNELTPQVKEMLVKLNAAGAQKTRIFIENIQVNKNGMDIQPANLALRCSTKR